MSDFFGDDFTAELKNYFLQSLLQEGEKFQDLLDEVTFKRVLPEVREQLSAWVVDAKTNEFIYLAAWLESFVEKTREFSDYTELKSALQSFLTYVGKLAQGESDSADLASQFSFVAGGKKDALYLHCKVGVQDFVIPIQYVLEISGPLPLFPLPEKQMGLLGVIPFRGEALPVFDLSEYGFQKIESDFYYFVICDHESSRFALQVSETDELLNVNEKELQAKDVSASMTSANFIQSFFIREDKSLMVLDIDKLVAA
ncbi:chemotaxis protein CheW [Bdellovibrio sp. HCB2-146]|uniref:chemotaxis protein CheW n=1 Tax=Bdellovibrio sp. HCB2-146 TaxID=3394362 RepID=UPI0039BCA6EC